MRLRWVRHGVLLRRLLFTLAVDLVLLVAFIAFASQLISISLETVRFFVGRMSTWRQESCGNPTPPLPPESSSAAGEDDLGTEITSA